MRTKSWLVVAATLLAAGCSGAAPTPAVPRPGGRYAGIGVFDAGRVWRAMVAPVPKDRQRATIADDEHVIVVVDSVTGEVRQCGDHSGYCVAANPWSGSAAALPAALSAHASDLDAQRADDAGAAANAAVPAAGAAH